MPTPDFVRLSHVPFPPRESVRILTETVFKPRAMRLRSVARLQWTDSEYYGHLELDGDLIDCSVPDEALCLVEGNPAWSLVYVVPSVRACVYFNFFHYDDAATGLALTLDSSIPHHRTHEDVAGGWLRSFLVDVVTSLNVTVCGYGSDDAYRVRYESLDPIEVLTRLESGRVIRMAPPAFHAISQSLVAAEQVRALVDRFKTSRFFEYYTERGYHVLTHF